LRHRENRSSTHIGDFFDFALAMINLVRFDVVGMVKLRCGRVGGLYVFSIVSFR